MRNWSDVLPEYWAIKQTAYERRKLVQRLRSGTNMTYEEIGEKMGVTRERVRQIALRAARCERPPIEIYFERIDDLSEIANWGKCEKARRSLLKERKELAAQ